MSNVQGRQPVFCRLARPKGRPSSQIVPQPRARPRLRRWAKESAPKNAGQGQTVAKALAATARDLKSNTGKVARLIISIAGSLEVGKLSTVQVDFINLWLGRYTNAFSKHRRAGAARTVFRRLWEDHNAPRLHQYIIKVHAPKPRNTTATAAEKKAILAAAEPHLRCWLLLCSDLAIRSGTAAKMGPAEYSVERGELQFRTKYENAQSLPVTAELRSLFALCKGDGTFVEQLKPGRKAAYKNLIDDFAKLKRKLKITRKLTPHDLRRTTARAVYSLTHDLRQVQALLGHSDLPQTAWYLQDAMTEVTISTLELAKLNPTTEAIQ